MGLAKEKRVHQGRQMMFLDEPEIYKYCILPNKPTYNPQSELPRPISWNSVESDLGCTLRIYFDNVTQMLHNVTQKPCQHNNNCDCSKTNGYV